MLIVMSIILAASIAAIVYGTFWRKKQPSPGKTDWWQLVSLILGVNALVSIQQEALRFSTNMAWLNSLLVMVAVVVLVTVIRALKRKDIALSAAYKPLRKILAVDVAVLLGSIALMAVQCVTAGLQHRIANYATLALLILYIIWYMSISVRLRRQHTDIL